MDDRTKRRIFKASLLKANRLRDVRAKALELNAARLAEKESLKPVAVVEPPVASPPGSKP